MNKKTFITTLLTLLILLLSSGCNSVPKQDQPNKDVVFVKDINLLSKSETVDTSADNIDTLTPNIPAVKTETAKLKVVAKELVEDDKAVKEYKDNIKKLMEQLAAKDKTIETLKSESNKAFHNMLSYGMYLGGVLIFIGIIGVIVGTKFPLAGGFGMASLAAGISTVVIAYVLMTQMMWFVPIGVLIVLAILGYAIYSAVKHSKAQYNKEEALTDLTKTVEFVKHKIGNESWNEIKDVVGKMQKPSTQAIVAQKKATEINTKYSAMVK